MAREAVDIEESSHLNNQNNGERLPPSNQNWTVYLILCCLTVTLCGSFNFGYNISAMNSPSNHIKAFIRQETFLFWKFHNGTAEMAIKEPMLIANQKLFDEKILERDSKKAKYIECSFWGDYECMREIDEYKRKMEKKIRDEYNMTIDERMAYANRTLQMYHAKVREGKIKLAEGEIKVNKFTEIIWTLINVVFVFGGLIGAITSKYIMDWLGRKNGILFHTSFTIVASVLVLLVPILKSPMCILASRLLNGIQSGMACTIVPTYLSEIAPMKLRGQTGVLHQLQICIGILLGQALGLRQVLGGPEYWSYLLAVPLVPSLIGGLALLFFFPETPKALLIKQKSLEKARSALQKLRSDKNVHSDIQEIYDESKASDGSGSGNGGGGGLLGVGELFTSKELRWPLITSLVIMSVQQLCGVNAIFFYSASIFKSAGIPDEFIQYAILSTGLVNVVMTFCSILLVDKLGRKPLLTFPMLLMILNFVALTACLALQSPERPLLSYATVALVILFIVCFAIGLGPIPFVYVTECFRQNARSSAISVAVTVNYISAIVLTLGFPFLQAALGEYVFLVFLVTVSLGLAVVWSKVPETKGKSIEEIIASFQ